MRRLRKLRAWLLEFLGLVPWGHVESILESQRKRHEAAIADQRRAHEAAMQSESDRHHKDCESQRKTLNRHHAAELEKVTKSVKRIVDNCCDLLFDKTTDRQYVMSVVFDERMMGGLGHHEDLEMIAQYVADRVRAEIASSRFVKSAYQLDRERRRQARCLYPFLDEPPPRMGVVGSGQDGYIVGPTE